MIRLKISNYSAVNPDFWVVEVPTYYYRSDDMVPTSTWEYSIPPICTISLHETDNPVPLYLLGNISISPDNHVFNFDVGQGILYDEGTIPSNDDITEPSLWFAWIGLAIVALVIISRK